MDIGHYLNLFQKSLDAIDQAPFQQQQLNLKVGIWLDSVVLKIQNKDWLPAGAEPLSTGIFFSVWINDDAISRGRISYNIHALKLRDLKTHRIQSLEFADAFRQEFQTFEKGWPNVSTKFGPLTLMEGWLPLDDATLVNDVAALAQRFLSIAPITHKLLAERKK